MPDLSSFELDRILQSPLVRNGIWVLIAIVGLGILNKLWNWLRRPTGDASPDMAPVVRLELNPTKPLAFPVHVRHLPSRLAAVVVAPWGSGTEAPSVAHIPSLVNNFVPRLSNAIQEHGAVMKVWPKQVSKTGFGHALMRNIHIPGGKWRDSRWCLICGPASVREQRFVIGLVTVFDASNSIDLIRVENDGEWSGVVQVADSRSAS